MIPDSVIKNQINLALRETDFSGLGEKIKGKVRDIYAFDDKLLLVSTDRLSAFDRIICTIPFKGQILNQTSFFWFEKTKNIVKNHVIDVPDPNATIAKKCKVIPVEMVVRGYISGVTKTSAWYNYEKGIRNFCGNILPKGMKKNQIFDRPIITPTTKAAYGSHDESISREEIIKQGLADKETYEKMESISLRLFGFGAKFAEKNNLILADTKYEFGFDEDGILTLIDEIHTPDSARFWIRNSYEKLFSQAKEPETLGKEYLRQFLKDKGFAGEGNIPKMPDEIKIEAAKRYIKAYEMITGSEFKAKNEDVLKRIENSLKKSGIFKSFK
ncbi:phosphoribosylaminoimidazolesuccinocarboxamide synthase [Candidatus Woesearchaeota archaeon]|nr:phosphoribosylaminoimidazolesuccinocarboxamide synthase [Candidatus Woesearchaeota archaeon]